VGARAPPRAVSTAELGEDLGATQNRAPEHSEGEHRPPTARDLLAHRLEAHAIPSPEPPQSAHIRRSRAAAPCHRRAHSRCDLRRREIARQCPRMSEETTPGSRQTPGGRHRRRGPARLALRLVDGRRARPERRLGRRSGATDRRGHDDPHAESGAGRETTGGSALAAATYRIRHFRAALSSRGRGR
jgi:hypothetical protein